MGLSNLPPGVTNRMIEETYGGYPCDCCGEAADNCQCPECPTCGAQGDPNCYKAHGLRYSKAQRIGQTKVKIAGLQEQIADHGQYIAWLEQQPDDWRDDPEPA